MRGMTRFDIKGKLALRYMGPFKIIERVGDVAHRLRLSPQLSHDHDVFHVSMLKKYICDASYDLTYAEIPLHPDVT